MSDRSFHYEGTELDLFSHAHRWKAYWSSQLLPWMGTRVLDVGAGLGATAATFARHNCEVWTALEPDPQLVEKMRLAVASGTLPVWVSPRCGTLSDLGEDDRFDTILYIDVLEHIEDDAGELLRATKHLLPGGRLLVLAPAHNWLYTPFDRAIGHFRRYDRKTLLDIKPTALSTVDLRYLDSAGMLASLGNRLILRSASPTRAQIDFWDRCLVPLSVRLDRMTGGRIGKSLLLVCQFHGLQASPIPSSGISVASR